MSKRPLSVLGHIKLSGIVDEISEDRTKWIAILSTINGPIGIEMSEHPLPPDVEEGWVFTWHRTKGGRQYLYWPTYYISQRRIKKARQYSNELFRTFRTTPSVSREQLPAGWMTLHARGYSKEAWVVSRKDRIWITIAVPWDAVGLPTSFNWPVNFTKPNSGP